MTELWTAAQAGAHCKTKKRPHGVSGATYRRYVGLSGAPDAVARDVKTGEKLYDPDAVLEWNANRPGQGARNDLKGEPVTGDEPLHFVDDDWNAAVAAADKLAAHRRSVAKGGETICLYCGRRGTRGFNILSGDPYGDDAGRVSWICASEGACARRQRSIRETNRS